MPWFALVGRDAPDRAELRQRHRPAHLEGLERLDDAGRLRHAGPLLDEAGAPRGSVVIFEAYVTEGVFGHYEVWETRPVFPRARD